MRLLDALFCLELALCHNIRHVESSTTRTLVGLSPSSTVLSVKKDIIAEFQDANARTKHRGKRIKFTISRAPNQSQLGLTGGDKTITNMLKCSKIDAENVASSDL